MLTANETLNDISDRVQVVRQEIASYCGLLEFVSAALSPAVTGRQPKIPHFDRILIGGSITYMRRR